MMKVAVIIVTYNALPWREKCLAPLANNYSFGNVYIIDNGSTDGTQDFILSNYPNFYLHQSKINLGFGKANNLGFKIALKDGCTHFLLLNQDAHISWDNIIKLVSIQNENNEYGILSPIQMHNNSVVDRLHLMSLLKNNIDYFNDLIAHVPLKDVYNISYTNAAIWLITKNCLRKVGGFDPLFPHYGEDTEYAQRVKYLGFKFGLCPLVDGYHYRNQKDVRVMNARNFVNLYLIQLKDLNYNLGKIYFRLFGQLIIKIMLKDDHIIERFKATVKVILKYRTLKKHRLAQSQNNFFFIEEI